MKIVLLILIAYVLPMILALVSAYFFLKREKSQYDIFSIILLSLVPIINVPISISYFFDNIFSHQKHKSNTPKPLKTKLLKIIRKRYSITHYPNGYVKGGYFYEGPLTTLTDSLNDNRLKVMSSNNKKDSREQLMKTLMRWIEDDYGMFNSKKRKVQPEKLWYNNKK
jgi:hypothetical protein